MCRVTEAPVHATATVDVTAPPDKVWQVLVEAAAWSTWYPDIRNVDAHRPLQGGDAFTFKTGPVTIAAVVDLSEPSSQLRFTGSSRGATAVYDFRLHPTETGTTVSAEQTMAGPAVRAMRPMLQKIADTSLPEWLAALRNQAESGR